MGLLSKWVESLDFDYHILPACTRLVSPRSHCEQCVLACEVNAVKIKKGIPSINHNKCLECGHCISACPVQAVAGIYPQRTIIQNQLVIKDERIPTTKELLILYKKGVKVVISESPTLLKLCEGSINKANILLEQLGEDLVSSCVKSVREEEYFSRRELFAFWALESKSVAKQVAPAKWRFNQNDFNLPKYYPDYQFAKITIDIEKCSLCNTCKKLCKKDCFEINEGKFTISSQGCSMCNLCVDTCPQKAIMVEEQISNEEKTILPIFQTTCESCNKTVYSLSEKEEECIACRKRKSFLNQSMLS
ncbi:4Fe-4S dicluster domain-containing protein [Cytobacillus spongiae]|jgi:ferredoxin|uniref:4Fe-4S dicluster domain-containing protein n=1 Tax=Cytobacillus spongiae TaxID=2901381 RepID=UPI001F261ADE|nr:4Fe-4S dicluster domain-containing protein [Cytobacillus spongiae]UII56574.1 4Fe-4S dicluster domain-containing protein [Cytobacillus spongiae]